MPAIPSKQIIHAINRSNCNMQGIFSSFRWNNTGVMKITNYLLIFHQRSGMVSVPFKG